MARILIVDDEEQVRIVLTRLLKLHGHQVDEAVDGAQAVDQVQKKRYDLMIIDRNMPKMSGVEAVTMLRTSERFKDLKILMVTMDSLTGDIDQAFEAGVDGYVVKPFEIEKVLAKVEATLRR